MDRIAAFHSERQYSEADYIALVEKLSDAPAVDMVDGKMREVAQRTKSTIAERVAVMAALHIAHEHLSGVAAGTAGEGVDTSDAKRRIEAMGARIDTVLAPQQRLDI